MLGKESGLHFSSAPKFGNALCYSESDMVALTTEHLIYILSMNLGSLSTYDVIHKKDRITRDIGTTPDCVFPSVLPEEANKYSVHTFRHSAWSPRGGAPNGGCLLATVSTDGRVTVHRPPAVADNILASQRWIEVADLYGPLFDHCKKEEFNKGVISGESPAEELRPGPKRKIADTEVSGAEAIRRMHMLETLCLCWSPGSTPADAPSSQTTKKPTELFLVLGGKSHITLWKCKVPGTPPFEYKFTFSSSISTNGQWISAMSWKGNQLGIAFTDGSVRAWEITNTHQNQPTINQTTKVGPDMVYPTSIAWADDALWVSKGHSLVKINKGGSVVMKGEHTADVKAMCHCPSTNQIITLTEDGTMRGWEAKTCKTLWERETEFSRKNLGWHGLASSPFGRYMLALEQISGNFDQMYKARNATGKIWMVPTGDINPLGEFLLSQVERGSEESVWDVVYLLDKERDASLLFKITDALETYYYKERQGNTKPHIRALCLANVLYETASYVTDQAMQDTMRQNKQKNVTEIISKYIQKVFQNFKVAEKKGGKDFAIQLTDREILCLKNMYSWAESFAPDLKNLEIEAHVSHTSIAEACPFCKQPVPFTSHASDKCSNGHFLLRCTRTFIVLGSHVLWNNSFTSTKSLIFTFEREDVPQTNEFKWLLGDLTPKTYPVCPLYNIPFMRFPPAMLDKLDKENFNKN
eukprot:Phypoly_transcript_02747.p1 GENE.Phypoly_transcript_02747~~Phypoly_transcript_02747.p1  ORF type:complete len:697 (+),score=74.87 Phypoly_transcript_02747:597-2687(+)